jgi:hypothetical protein
MAPPGVREVWLVALAVSAAVVLGPGEPPVPALALRAAESVL